jgi:hypothetical protein
MAERHSAYIQFVIYIFNLFHSFVLYIGYKNAGRRLGATPQLKSNFFKHPV